MPAGRRHPKANCLCSPCQTRREKPCEGYSCRYSVLPLPMTKNSELTQPLLFRPVFMERIWGGRRLETDFGKDLPPNKKIGEAWEIVDRPEAQSTVRNGPLQDQTL